MVGASTGAAPMTRKAGQHRRGGTAVEEVTDDGQGDDRAGRRPHPLQHAQSPEDGDVRRDEDQQRGQHVQRGAGQQRPTATHGVGQRSEHELPEGQADERAGQRQLDGGRGGPQVCGDGGQGREVHVDGQRTDGDEGAEGQRGPRHAGPP
jgi:hypothetical protein